MVVVRAPGRGLLPVNDRDAILIVEQFVEHLSEVEQLAMVDADGEDPRWLQHRMHHFESGKHEAHPLRVLRRLILRNEFSHAGIIGVLVPLVVVPEVLAGVVRRICENQVDLTALAKEGYHGLQVVALDDEVFALLLSISDRDFGHTPLNPRPDFAGELPSIGLPRELDLHAALGALLEQLD